MGGETLLLCIAVGYVDDGDEAEVTSGLVRPVLILWTVTWGLRNVWRRSVWIGNKEVGILRYSNLVGRILVVVVV